MVKKRMMFLLIAIICGISSAAAQEYSFEEGLDGWSARGNVQEAPYQGLNGKGCIEIMGSGSVMHRFPASPLSIVQFSVNLKSGGNGAKGYVFIRFDDAAGNLLLQYQGKTVSAATYESTGYYTETPPRSRYLEIIIRKDSSGKGGIYASDMKVGLNVEKIHHDRPRCNLDQYMLPFWDSDTIFNETVLLFSEKGQKASGKLLYTPGKILSVRSYDLKTTYTKGADYIIKGNAIIRTDHSTMPFRADTSFDHHDLAWYNIQSQWVVVTYTHADRWNGPEPSYKGNRLPNTLAALKAKAPLSIVAYGMSITRGMDVSGYDHVPPYMPTYVALFARQLRKNSADPYIHVYNAGLPGATVEWGAKYAEKYVNPLHPGLVIIDFGMNDFWTVSPDQFREYIKTIIRKIRAGNPHAEFILLSNLKFDPAYASDTDKNKKKYLDNMKGYSDVLRQMEATGVVNLDMTTLSGEIYHLKKAKDCIVNPMHPNDYMARWYAQGLTALLDKKDNY